MEKRQRILMLLDNYTANMCTDELEELFSLIDSGQYDDILDAHIQQHLYTGEIPGANLEAYRSEAIVHKILSSCEENTVIIRKISRSTWLRRLSVAAAVLVFFSVAAWYMLRSSEQNDLVQASAAAPKDSRSVTNNSDKAMLVQLEDGSRITLQPEAVLTYPAHFSMEKREVVLEGEAFFDIAKNPERPFLVYHENLVTRVLGTSFYIRYNPDHHEIEVEVSTGKVEVYENVKRSRRSKSNGVIITPNQKVLYAEGKRMFSTSLVDNPVPILNKDDSGRLVPVTVSAYEFEREALSNIIPLLESTYGIDIEIENESLNNCLFSGDISDQNLYSKLDILCQTIGITYELKGTRILIKGKGCKK